ncbi:gliding motility-associated C-terminal domain-containing protein [Mucilaginibacter sp. BJC16-A38]|nr:gliding motility-associated C-terminal domain-containing protein [Mucilaginibacter phenanthrenivorans]
MCREYTITVSGVTAVNYSFNYTFGVLTVNPDIKLIVINNTFTPNGDGINDTWTIENLNSYTNNTVGIYNRYGEKVYSSVGCGIP